MTAPDPGQRKLVTTAAEILAKTYTYAEHLAGCEAAYRHGVQHGLTLAGDLADESGHVVEVRRRIARAERLAGELRGPRRNEGRGMVLDWIRGRLARTAPPSARAAVDAAVARDADRRAEGDRS